MSCNSFDVLHYFQRFSKNVGVDVLQNVILRRILGVRDFNFKRIVDVSRF